MTWKSKFRFYDAANPKSTGTVVMKLKRRDLLRALLCGGLTARVEVDFEKRERKFEVYCG